MTAAFVLGVLAGLVLGALVVVALVRSTSRITGAAPRAVPGLVLDGLRPGGAVDGVAAQRALARRLKRTGRRTAAGRRVAATTLEVHVGPEDHRAIEDAMGLPAAEADLVAFYTAHAGRAGWLVGAPPELTIVRDISLRPRQAFVRAETRADPSAPSAPSPEPSLPVRQERRPAPQPADRPPVAARPAAATPTADDGGVTDVLPRELLDAAVTDVLPRGLVDEDAVDTRAFPIGLAEQSGPGDLLVVHGTDVRVVPVGRGLATVGRAAHNDIVVDAPGVADDHLLLERRQQGWWVVPGPSTARATLDGRALGSGLRLEGQGVVELGRGAKLRLTVEAGR